MSHSSSPPALYTLLELNKFYPEIVKDPKCEIYLDGGVRRGTDVVKALCLGANGVGIGQSRRCTGSDGEANRSTCLVSIVLRSTNDVRAYLRRGRCHPWNRK